MAHIQSKPVHESDAQHKNDHQVIHSQRSAATGSQRGHQNEATHVDKISVLSAAESSSQGVTIMGFPWQFVAVIGVIAGGVLAVVLKAIGLF